MADVTVEGVQIEVSALSSAAARSIDELTNTLSRLKSATIPFPKSIVEETGRKQYKIKGLPFKTSSDAENPDYLPLPEVGEHNYDVYGTVATKEEIDALLDRWHNKFHKY